MSNSLIHLSWATWANSSQSLIFHERPEWLAHSCSFVLSDLSESPIVAHLIWVNERIPNPDCNLSIFCSFICVNNSYFFSKGQCHEMFASQFFLINFLSLPLDVGFLSGQFITSQVSKLQQSSSVGSPTASNNQRRFANNNNSSNSNVKQLKVSVNNSTNSSSDSPPSSSIGQADDGFGSLPATPTDFGRHGGRGAPPLPQSLPVAASMTNKPEYAESIQTDDGIYTSTEEVAAPPSITLTTSITSSASESNDSDSEGSVSDSESLSVVSGEDVAAAGSAVCSDGQSAAAGGHGGRHIDVAATATVARQQQPPPHTGHRERAVATKICTGSFSRGIERFRSESPAAAVRNSSSGTDSWAAEADSAERRSGQLSWGADSAERTTEVAGKESLSMAEQCMSVVKRGTADSVEKWGKQGPNILSA